MKIKANILLITLFLLMMSSLSALLVTAYIKNLIKFSASFHDYYKSYYIANAGLELALVKTNGNVRAYGFEDTVGSGSVAVKNNFSGTNKYFTTSISTSSSSLGEKNTSNSTYMTGCSDTTVEEMGYEIAPGGCVPIILLKDNDLSTFSGGEGRLEKIGDNDLNPIARDGGGGYPLITVYSTQGFTSLLTKLGDSLTFDYGWSKDFSGGVIQNIIGNTVLSDNAASPGGEYILMIANTTSQTGHYCLSANGANIPTQYVTISAQGSYANVSLNLKGVRKAGLPADFCYTAISN